MTPKQKKTIFFLVAGVIAIAATFAFYQYNKGPVSIKDAKGIEVTAINLYESYTKDSSSAIKKYSNKIVEATGVVAQVTNNQQNQLVALIITNETGAFVNCTMEDSLATIKEDETVTIKGICSGIGAGDAALEITGDVYLIRCYRVK